MKKWMVSFAINNTQEEYAQCLNIIEYIERQCELSVCQEFERRIRFSLYDDWMRMDEIIIGKYWNDAECKLADLAGEREVSYLLRVNCADDNDIANLLYYCLLCDRVDKDCILCVESSQKVGANIRDFLSWLLDGKVIRNCYTYIDGSCREISAHRVEKLRYIWKNDKIVKEEQDILRVMKQFSPIFRIDESIDDREYGSVGYWRQPMKSFLLRLYRSMNEAREKMPGRDEEKTGYRYLEDYFLAHICPADLRMAYPEELWRGYVCAREKHLLDNFVECFCTVESGKAKSEYKGKAAFMRKRYDWWKSKELYELISEIPLLAMYIFCVSDYFLRDMEHDSWEKVEEEIINARDMADGVLQLLENIYHSELKKGYFCFRVHNDSKDRSGKYLRKEYKNYMEIWDKNENVPHDFLEIKIADFSHVSIPLQFYKGFDHRMGKATGTDKKVYQTLERQAKQLKVASFFGSNNEFWSKYSAISENVIHHYGLQVFESLIDCYDGYFQVKSQGAEKLNREAELYSTHEQADIVGYGIPGTQYDILVPFRRQVQLQNLSLNVNINYTDGLLTDYRICEGIEFTGDCCGQIVQEVKKKYPNMSYQEHKERVIRILADCLDKRIKEKSANSRRKMIIHFSAEKISLTAIELFCKALMLNISRKSAEDGFYVMIMECTPSHFVEITRMFALFYNKQGENLLMRNTQIFMSGQKEGEEFLITGSNLGEAIGSTEKLAFARCTHPDCLKILKKTLKNHKMGVKPNEMVSIVPFDMIQYNNQKSTLLEQRLEAVLAQDIQSEKFGCKLENLHVRIGSKIHVQTFYEAELLLHNNYYTSRFAYWLYNKLSANKTLKKRSPFVLVGYENYSEMLLNELTTMFLKRGIKTEYLIYEERIMGKFRGKSPFEKYKNYQIVIIVPINSTMTTHIKISGFLEKAIKEALKKKGDDIYSEYELKKVFNYGIVLISSEGTNSYWKKVNSSNADRKVIRSKINRQRMEYYIEAVSKWEAPLKCKACFPEDDYTKEIPMVETNKESVVPMHAISIRKPKNAKPNSLAEGDGQIADLSRFLVYKHVERNGNHFNYYFATEKLWDFKDVRDKVRSWLEEKAKELFGKEKCKVYDVIVAPLHYSNTVFVEEVNGCLFKNAALVLHFDADREFRMNVRTKYSSIQQLYDNLCTDNEKSIINFHYIDDTIVSGRTFRRMKSLINSMFSQRDSANIQINIFKSIVLLLNRMSSSSICDYISDKNYFLSYYNLNISSMRVNADACVLCKKYSEWSRLAQQASLNRVFDYWQNRARLLKCIPVEAIDNDNEDEPTKRKRNERYMIASHRAKKLLDPVCESGDKEYIEQMMVEKLFPDDVSKTVDELIAILKILGRPFLTFRREEREAVFHLMLVMLDTLLAEREPIGEDKLNSMLRQVWNNGYNRDKIVEILLNRLAELESNYIMRKRSMNRILEFSNHMDEKRQKEFIDNYLNRLKQLVGQSNDFAKGLYLEYLLLYDEEFTGHAGTGKIVSLEAQDPYTAFKRNVYLENTKLINYGIEYLAKGFRDGKQVDAENLKEELNQNYYFDNFIQYLFFHKIIFMKGKEKVKQFVSFVEQKKLEGMVHFELLYQKIFGNSEQDSFGSGTAFAENTSVGEEKLKDTFSEMMKFLKDAGGALDGEIIVPYGKDEEGKKYIALGLGTSTELRSLENMERQMWEFMEENKDFEEDTYKICCTSETENEVRKWVLLKFSENNASGNDVISDIFLLFPFGIQEDGDIIRSLKNILVFKHKIWQILNLSSGTLLQNWTNTLFYKQQMLKSRAVGHSELDTLIEQLEEFVKSMCNVEARKEETEWEKQLCRNYFELLVNSLIGCMNAQVLGNRCTDRLEMYGQSFMNFWEAKQKVFDVVSELWKLKIEIDYQGLEEYRIRHGTKTQKGKKVWPCEEVLLVLFLTVFHNIWGHGKQSEDRVYKVNISVEDEVLCISNCIDVSSRNNVEKAIRAEAYRSGEGISQAVIYDICQNWYGGLRYEDTFRLREAEGMGNNELQYVVRLPIIERYGEYARI